MSNEIEEIDRKIRKLKAHKSWLLMKKSDGYIKALRHTLGDIWGRNIPPYKITDTREDRTIGLQIATGSSVRITHKLEEFGWMVLDVVPDRTSINGIKFIVRKPELTDIDGKVR